VELDDGQRQIRGLEKTGADVAYCHSCHTHARRRFHFYTVSQKQQLSQRRRVSISSTGAILGELRSQSATDAERDADGVQRRGEWEGVSTGLCPLPIQLSGTGERRKLPQRGPGQSPGLQRIWCIMRT